MNGYYFDFDFETVPAGTSVVKVRADVAVDSNYNAVFKEITVDRDEFAPQGLARDLIPIRTLDQLDAMRYDLDGDGTPTGTATEIDAYNAAFPDLEANIGYRGYQLANDLDFKNGSTDTDDFSIWAEGSTATDAIAAGWDPIGDGSDEFDAIFEGNDNQISNLYINRPSTDNVGLFGYVGADGEILRLGIEGGSVTGGSSAGGPGRGQ